MNLLKKLGEKFKSIKDETKKRIVATVLAGGIALSGLGMTGCTGCNPDPNNTNPPVTNPGENNGGTENGGTQTPGNNNGGNNSGSQTPDYSKYSQILQNVLTDEYYRGQIGNAEINPTYFYNHPLYRPTPYGFLEDEGFDISKFKNKNLTCDSDIFSIGNDLYIELKAEISSSTNYFKNYILKYKLTEQERKELYNLFKPIGSNNNDETYFQAPFFVQELSYVKDPEILSISYSTSSCTNNAISFFNKQKLMTSLHTATYIKSEQKPNSVQCYHYFLIRPTPSKSRQNSRVGYVKTITNGHSYFYDNDKFVLTFSVSPTNGGVNQSGLDILEASITDIISYASANHTLKDIRTSNHWDFFEEIVNNN